MTMFALLANALPLVAAYQAMKLAEPTFYDRWATFWMVEQCIGYLERQHAAGAALEGPDAEAVLDFLASSRVDRIMRKAHLHCAEWAPLGARLKALIDAGAWP